MNWIQNTTHVSVNFYNAGVVTCDRAPGFKTVLFTFHKLYMKHIHITHIYVIQAIFYVHVYPFAAEQPLQGQCQRQEVFSP
jgi:hypothetical protein